MFLVLGLLFTAFAGSSAQRTPADVTVAARSVAQPGGAGGREAFVEHGEKLFTEGTFNGNGRTCVTCHSATTGTLSPEDAQARFQANRAARGHSPAKVGQEALFRAIDSDSGLGESYERLLEHATIRVLIDLPENVTLEADPSARTVIVNRGIPSFINSGLNKVLMHDGREPDLESQAFSAILGHAEAARLPTPRELRQIADFERTQFSRPELARYFQGGPTPSLPSGETPEEIRGRRHFEPGGLCGLCHSGPMLNETSALHPVGAGQHFENIFVSERNLLGNPVQIFVFRNADGTTNRVETPDPGLGLVRGDPSLVNYFRIPTLWNVKNTAPYFHDNSAKTLEEMMEHYQLYLRLSDADVQDIIAYLKLL